MIIYSSLTDLLPRGVISMLAGPLGIGKSTIACALAIAASLDGDVLFVSPESEFELLADRLVRTAAYDPEIYFNTPDEFREHPDGSFAGKRLVVIDPVRELLGDRDFNRTGLWLHAIHSLAERAQTAVLLICHTVRSAQGPPIYSLAGSAALVAVPRRVWVLAEDKHNPSRRVMRVARNTGSEDAPDVIFEIHEGIARHIEGGNS